MAGRHVLQKLRLGFAGLRGYASRSWNAPETCLIRGVDHDIVFPGTLLDSLAEHEAEFPLARKLPADKLIQLNPARPNEITDHWRQIFYSAFLQSYLCKSQDDCVANLFDYSNIGVIKGFNLLGFKKFDRVEGKKNSDHIGFTGFVEDALTRFCGTNAILQFPECKDFLDACPGSDDDVLRHHSFFLEDEELAELYCDIHRLVRHEFKNRGLASQGKDILIELEGSFHNRDVVYDCVCHKFLFSLLGSHHSPVLRKVALSDGFILRPPHQGSAIVDLHRNAMQHAIDDKTLEAVRLKSPLLKDLWNNYTRADVIKSLRYMYPRYPGKALWAFKKAGVFHHLGLHRRLRIQDLYKYVSPVNDNKEGSQRDLIKRIMPTNCVDFDTHACTDEWLNAAGKVILPGEQPVKEDLFSFENFHSGSRMRPLMSVKSR